MPHSESLCCAAVLPDPFILLCDFVRTAAATPAPLTGCYATTIPTSSPAGYVWFFPLVVETILCTAMIWKAWYMFRDRDCSPAVADIIYDR